MKICLVNSFFDPYVLGGAEVYTKKIAEELSQHHEVVFLTSGPYSGINSLRGKNEQIGAIKVFRFFPANIYYSYNCQNKPLYFKGLWHLLNTWNIHSYLVIRDFLKNEKPDIIHSHNLRGLSFSTISAINATGIPHMHTLHDYELIDFKSNIGKASTHFNFTKAFYIRAMRMLTRNVKLVTADTEFVLDLFSSFKFFKDSTKKRVIPAGFSIENTQNIKKNMSIPTILYVGKLDHSKGILTLLKAFADIKGEDIRLNIVGQGPLEKAVLNATQSDKRIIYHGYVPQGEELYRLYSESSVLVFPSMWLEPLGLVAIEAFSFGTPVIASNIGGIPEVVKDGYNGLLFRPGDAADLINAILRIISNGKLLEQLGENASNSAEKYNIGNHMSKLLQAYEEIIA